VPNAADNENFIHLDPRPFIDKYKLHDKKIILFVGIINQAKRPDLLIRALEKVVKIIPDAHLLIVGPDGGMLSKVKELGKALNLENHFTCTGPLYGMEKQQAYKSAKLFVLPSDLDAYPLVLMEALSHGLPVVTTDSRGPSDIIENGKTGFVVPKRNVEQIADRIIKLLSDEKLYNKMSQNARDTAIKKYKADSITQQIENIYFELLKK
jgi:poly(glycerol-phosphate) alpha-glucosyltransferase